MKKWVLLMAAMLLVLMATGAMASGAWDDSVSVYQEGDVVATEAETEAGNPVFVITMEDGGVMRGVLYPDVAPQSVGNFIALANSGYYDGLIFHRVIPEFMIQGGCPQGVGTGGPGWSIKGEFASNGVTNDLLHTYGVLSMARSQQNDSAGSQFFVMTSDSPHLDGDYAAFGLVTEGMEVADKIVMTERDMQTNKPLTPQTIQSIRVETFGVDYPFDKL